EPFDAIVGRLVLFHMADPVAAVRHHVLNLRPGGLFVALDFDIGGARTYPALDVADEALGWVVQAFSAAGGSPRIGSRRGPALDRAGLDMVKTFGVQAYLAPNDPAGPALLTGVVRSLAEVITTRGIATVDKIDLATLEQRIADGLRREDAVFLPPTVVGAW